MYVSLVDIEQADDSLKARSRSAPCSEKKEIQTCGVAVDVLE